MSICIKVNSDLPLATTAPTIVVTVRVTPLLGHLSTIISVGVMLDRAKVAIQIYLAHVLTFSR